VRLNRRKKIHGSPKAEEAPDDPKGGDVKKGGGYASGRRPKDGFTKCIGGTLQKYMETKVAKRGAVMWGGRGGKGKKHPKKIRTWPKRGATRKTSGD